MWGATLWGGVHGSLSRVMIWGTHFEEVEVSDEESWVGQAKNEVAKEACRTYRFKFLMRALNTTLNL